MIRVVAGAKHSYGIAVLGMVCLYTVAITMFYYDWLFTLDFAVSAFVYEAVLNACLCVGAAGVVAALRAKASTRILAGFGAGAYAACFALAACALAAESAPLIYAAAACAGVGAGVLMPCWFTLAAKLPGAQYGYLLGAMSLACGATVIAVNALACGFMMAVCALLVGISLVLLAVLEKACQNAADTADGEAGSALAATEAVRHEPGAPSGKAVANDAPKKGAASEKGTPQEPNALRAGQPGRGSTGASALSESGESPWRKLVLPLVYVFFLSVVYGALDQVASLEMPVPPAQAGIVYQVGGAVADVLFLLYVRFGRQNYAALFNVLLGVIATGLLFLPFLSSTYGFALLVFTHTGWGMALLVSYALVIELLHGKPRELLAASAVVFAFPRPGLVLGSGVAAAIAVDGQFAFVQSTMLAFVLLYAIMAAVWFIRTREKRAAERAIRHRDDLIKRYARAREDMLALVCEDLAAEYGLTKREAEILNLFARGRDAAYAETALFLSRNTVKSYSKSLYAKLGVHARQELIDLVEARFPQA